jgi:hypothetical protein
VIDERKLAGLGRRLEGHRLEPEGVGERVGVEALEPPVHVEQAHAAGALARLNHQLRGAGVEPAVPQVDQLGDHLLAERAVVLLAQLVLHLEPATVGHGDDRRGP